MEALLLKYRKKLVALYHNSGKTPPVFLLVVCGVTNITHRQQEINPIFGNCKGTPFVLQNYILPTMAIYTNLKIIL